jgi:GTP-binding protein Era
VQTTRAPVRGIAIEGDSQLVFIDTPGIFRPKRKLDRAMVGAAWTGAGEADVIALLVDAAKGLDEEVEAILAKLEQRPGGAKVILILNKVDRLADKGPLLALAAEISGRLAADRVFMISALDGRGVGDLRAYLAGVVPPGPWHYPEDDISDLPVRMLSAEITREHIYHRLHDELPYAITVETTAFTERKAKGKMPASVRIEQTIFVERESQRKIVLGKGGATIKQIASEARRELMGLLETTVHLFVFVKVREGWEQDPERYREMGLEFPKE